MKKIETQRPRVPWSWVGWMTGPWLVLYYFDNLSDGGPLTFTIRRFVETPVLIGLLTSVNVGFNFTVGAAASYMSDRIWTRWGRRRPFLIVGWIGAAVMMFLVPVAPNVWMLAVFVLTMQFFADVAKPLEPLYNEVVPPRQRGRAGTMRNIAQQLMGLFFFGVMMAQFDAVHEFAWWGRVWRMTGETALYWAGGALTLGMAAFLAWGVRENPPRVQEPVRELGVRNFLHDVFGHRQWWMVYLLYATPMVAGPTGGSFTILMQTEQLGFSKAELGFAVSIGMVVMVVLFAPLAGYLTDHMSRMRLLRIGIVGPTVVEFVFFLHVRYVADYSIPLSTWIGYGLAGSALKTCAYLVWGALVFDYIPRNRFGTVSAGLVFVSGFVPFVLTNASGLWVTGFTRVFGPVGGSSYDYSSVYVMQVGCAAVALWMTYFFEREEKRGRVQPLGRMEAAV